MEQVAQRYASLAFLCGSSPCAMSGLDISTIVYVLLLRTAEEAERRYLRATQLRATRYLLVPGFQRRSASFTAFPSQAPSACAGGRLTAGVLGGIAALG